MTARKDNIWKTALNIVLIIVFSVCSSLITASYERGDIKARVSGLEENSKDLKQESTHIISKYSQDHDLLIQVNTKLDGVKEAVQDLNKKIDKLSGLNTSAGKK